MNALQNAYHAIDPAEHRTEHRAQQRALTAQRRWLLAASLAVFFMLLVTGCEANFSNDKVDATNRFMKARSSMALQMAERQFDSEDLDSAEKTLNDALKIHAKDGRIYLLLGRISLERGQLERAHRMFDTSIQFDEKLHGAYYFRGVVRQRWQQHELALADYSKAASIWRDKPTYLLAMAEMLIEMDRMDEALEQLKAKLVYFDQNAGLRLAIGQIYLMKDDAKNAARYYKQAALLAPEDLKVQEELAMVQLRAGQTDKAIRHLETLVTKQEYAKRIDVRITLGDAYLRLRRHASAKKVFADVVAMRPTDVDAWVKLGEASWSVGDTNGALRAAGRVRQLAPNRHEGFLLAGLVWHKRGRIEDAISMFDAAAEMAPDNHLPAILRGISLEKLGRSTAAAAAYREALRRKPNDRQARRLLAAVSDKQGR